MDIAKTEKNTEYKNHPNSFIYFTDTTAFQQLIRNLKFNSFITYPLSISY